MHWRNLLRTLVMMIALVLISNSSVSSSTGDASLQIDGSKAQGKVLSDTDERYHFGGGGCINGGGGC